MCFLVSNFCSVFFIQHSSLFAIPFLQLISNLQRLSLLTLQYKSQLPASFEEAKYFVSLWFEAVQSSLVLNHADAATR